MKTIMIFSIKEEDYEEYFGVFRREKVCGNDYFVIYDGITHAYNQLCYYIESETDTTIILKEKNIYGCN